MAGRAERRTERMGRLLLTASSCGEKRGARTGEDSLGSGAVGAVGEEDMEGLWGLEWCVWLCALTDGRSYKWYRCDFGVPCRWGRAAVVCTPVGRRYKVYRVPSRFWLEL